MNQRSDVELMRESLKSSLFVLATAFIGYSDINQTTHGKMIDVLESQSKRKLICVPRGCLKSSLACVAYPIWQIVRNPNIRILIDSELYTNSKTFLREIKGHLVSPHFEHVFGKFKAEPWSESEIVISQRTQNKKEATITIGGIGTTKVGQHYDLIIGDDYNSPSNTNSPENAKKVVDHYRYNISILEPTGTYVIIGTRYSELDLIGHILSTEIKES